MPPTVADQPSVTRAEVLALRLQRDALRRQLDVAQEEVDRLRQVTESLVARNAELQQLLRRARAAGRQVSPAELAGALTDAIERGSRALEGRVVAGARAEIRASLQLERNRAGLVVGDPRSFDSGSLSTIIFDLQALPLTPTQETGLAGLDAVVAAVLELQRVLDRPWPPAAREAGPAALVAVSTVAAAPPIAGQLGSGLQSLVERLELLGGSQPGLADAVADLAARRAALSPQPSGDELAGLARSLWTVATALAR
jgi:hypothetical protein